MIEDQSASSDSAGALSHHADPRSSPADGTPEDEPEVQSARSRRSNDIDDYLL
jgi:hypothetical protein